MSDRNIYTITLALQPKTTPRYENQRFPQRIPVLAWRAGRSV